jgi:hypothetical protein
MKAGVSGDRSQLYIDNTAQLYMKAGVSGNRPQIHIDIFLWIDHIYIDNTPQPYMKAGVSVDRPQIYIDTFLWIDHKLTLTTQLNNTVFILAFYKPWYKKDICLFIITKECHNVHFLLQQHDLRKSIL